METNVTTAKSKAGRRPIDPATKKKNRAISLTDAEYAKLNDKALAAGYPGPSSYIVKMLELS